jgi:hypothetical protein
MRSAITICGAIGGLAFGVAVFGLGFPDDPGGIIVGGIGSVMMLIGGFGKPALGALDRRRKRTSHEAHR